MGAGIGAGVDIIQQLAENGHVDTDEVIDMAIFSGADAGVKTASAAALTAGVKRGVIPMIPATTSVTTITGIAYGAVESVKVLGKVADGEMTLSEGVEEIEQTAVSCVTGAHGAAIGAAIGSTVIPIPIVGTAIGGGCGLVAPLGRTMPRLCAMTASWTAMATMSTTVTACVPLSFLSKELNK